jgi:hypothetical protein
LSSQKFIMIRPAPPPASPTPSRHPNSSESAPWPRPRSRRDLSDGRAEQRLSAGRKHRSGWQRTKGDRWMPAKSLGVMGEINTSKSRAVKRRTIPPALWPVGLGMNQRGPPVVPAPPSVAPPVVARPVVPAPLSVAPPVVALPVVPAPLSVAPPVVAPPVVPAPPVPAAPPAPLAPPCANAPELRAMAAKSESANTCLIDMLVSMLGISLHGKSSWQIFDAWIVPRPHANAPGKSGVLVLNVP